MLASLFGFSRWLYGEQAKDIQTSVDLTGCPYQSFDDWHHDKHCPYHSNFLQEWQGSSENKNTSKEQSLPEDEEPSEESGSEDESDFETLTTSFYRLAHRLRPVFYRKHTQSTFTDHQVAVNVTDTLYGVLGKQERKHGWVYIFRSPKYPGMFKVGYSGSKSNRLQQHRKCFPELIEVAAAIMPNAKRIEKMLLTEFAGVEHNMSNGCRICDVIHQEWLEVDRKTLLKSFKKWTNFALQEPYNKSGGLKRNTVLPHPADKTKRTRSSRTSTPSSAMSKNRGTRSRSATPTPTRRPGRSSQPSPLSRASSPSAGRPTTRSQHALLPDTEVSDLNSKLKDMSIASEESDA